MKRWQALAPVLVLGLVAGCAGGGPGGSSMSNAKADQSYPAAQSAPSTGGRIAASPAPQGSAPAMPESKSLAQAPSDMFFRDYGVGAEINTSRQTVSTFGIDVDTASFTLAKSHLERGMLPPPDAIRAEEFINFFPQPHQAPRDQAVALYTETAPSPFRPDLRLVQIGLKAREVDRGERKSANLTFVVDVSGSMNMENRLGLVKRSLHLLVDQLGRQDRVGLVVYGTRARVVLEHTPDKARIRSAIDGLAAEGSTNAEEGLVFGYDLATRGFSAGAINRVILCSDGVANVGETGPEAILRKVEDFRSRGITLTTVGVGMGNYNDVLLEQLADKGDGAYHYVDEIDEARRVFVNQLDSTLEVVARDVKVQVQFDTEQVSSFRLVGYENRGLRKEDFRNDEADAGDMGAGHTVTALYEVRLQRGARGSLGQVTVRYREPAGSGRALEMSASLSPRSSFGASPQLRWTAAVAEFAGVLKGSPWSAETRLSDIDKVARDAARDLDAGAPYPDFLDMVQRARRLQK